MAEKTLKQTMDSAMAQIKAAADQNRQKDPDQPPKLSFAFDLRTRRPTSGRGISGAVSTSKKP